MGTPICIVPVRSTSKATQITMKAQLWMMFACGGAMGVFLDALTMKRLSVCIFI